MKYLLNFFHQKVPESGTEIPAYYHNALFLNEIMLAVYFLISILIFIWKIQRFEIIPILLLALISICIANGSKLLLRTNVNAIAAITVCWCGWYIYAFGWGCGGQHMLIPLLILTFFNIYAKPWHKIANWLGLLSYRMVLFAFALNHVPVFQLDTTTNIVYQTANSMTLFLILAIDFIIFSSSIQATERELRLNNQELHKEADTDPLTGLANRRAMMDIIKFYKEETPDLPFCVAIGDIDFFKQVNDTYGHNCGDYTLQELAKLFRERSGNNYRVCRWGGEEFCFFIPGKIIDEAWNIMFDLCESVRKMPLCFEGNEFSITITIGIEENDFQSPVDVILDKADKKLYMGKVAGRNRVVM